jgi:hypothetical protein
MDILEAPNGKLRAGTFGKGLWENAKVVGSLPVTFESFTATPTDKGNQLTWVIGVQDNVSHYEVEYSTDMVNFAAVGTIPARAGTIHLTYSFLHKINNVKTGYYRIKVVDLDGDVMYSAIELVKGQQLISNFITYPNPTTGVFRVKMPTSIQGTFHLKLYDVAGKLVYSQEMRMQQGVTETDINISQVAAGNYQLICQDDKSKFVTRIIKR